MAEIQLTQKEIDERIAILKRYRSLLEQQRNKFREYLSVLEKQSSAIANDDTAAMEIHTELEQQIVANIGSLQKVISPMEKLYKEKAVSLNGAESLSCIPELKTDLKRLQEEVLQQNRNNRILLQQHLAEMKPHLQNFRNPYRNTRSIYARQDQTATLISVTG